MLFWLSYQMLRKTVLQPEPWGTALHVEWKKSLWLHPPCLVSSRKSSSAVTNENIQYKEKVPPALLFAHRILLTCEACTQAQSIWERRNTTALTVYTLRAKPSLMSIASYCIVTSESTWRYSLTQGTNHSPHCRWDCKRSKRFRNY